LDAVTACSICNPRQWLTTKEVEAFENGHDIGAEIVQSLREAKAGKTRVVCSPVTTARQNSGLLQTDFARLLGVSVRTQQGLRARAA
jgi:putative transcriptional regulator